MSDGKVKVSTHFAFSEHERFEKHFFLVSLVSLRGGEIQTQGLRNLCVEKLPSHENRSIQRRDAGLCETFSPVYHCVDRGKG